MRPPRQFADVRRRIPIVFAGTMFQSLVPRWRTTVLTLVELGPAAFFLAGVAAVSLGASAPWFVLVALLAAGVARAADMQSWVLFAPGGLVGRVEEAFGRRTSVMGGAAVLVERLFFVALGAALVGRYVVAGGVALLGTSTVTRYATINDLNTFFAIVVVGVFWLRTRAQRSFTSRFARWLWIPLVLLAVISVWSAIVVLRAHRAFAAFVPPTFDLATAARLGQIASDRPVATVLALLVGFAYVVPGLGSGFGLTRLAGELPQPRVRGLGRVARLAFASSLLLVLVPTAAFTIIVPSAVAADWYQAPFAGLAWYLPAPAWLSVLLLAALASSAALMLGYAIECALSDAENTLQRLSRAGVLSDALRVIHPKLGTATRLTDLAALAAVVTIELSGGHVLWLARAYGVGVAWVYAFGLLALIRLRRRPHPAAGPGSLQTETTSLWSSAAIIVGVLVAAAELAMLITGDPASWAATLTLVGTTSLLLVWPRSADAPAPPEGSDAFQLLPQTDLWIDRVDARPGNVLVAVRHPHSLTHLTAALHDASGRDVVVMTARLLGRDVEDDGSPASEATAEERFLFSQVTAIAERSGREIRLLIVPAHDAFDAVVAAVVRLRSSEVYVGESLVLSADEQARQLGEAWERADKPEHLNVRLVIQHRSGRTHAYYLGAHAPTLSERDLELIHRLWLDATKVVGRHVHHHDIVRAALTQMAEQLDGPNRDTALDAIREVARPGEEIAAVVRARDLSQLRDMMRNRPPQDVAHMLSHLGIEDQVIVFRVLPRKDAAAAFEYLAHEAQQSLLKAMGQQEIAGLLNDMSPDDRTTFLEELPAAVTRQLLSLLTPNERSVALKLLGYPEGSIGRLMTPDYVAVHEDWTIQQVIDHVRQHGQDSETLDVIYVVDDQGTLIDDFRIRELLLASPANRVADLMDRRFVALKATDEQEAVVAVFRQHDRVALPVTDTAGVLIGIVTVDDVLHVAEAEATEDIQRIGGLEALDEPYMKTAFWTMVRKRAGWLTALFLGEMLTATAMTVFSDELAKAEVLALFLPLIISSGGNSGSQGSTLVIRALALGEVGLRDWARIMRREIFMGLALGAILGSIGFVRITVWSMFDPTLYTVHWILVAVTVAVALVGVVLWGTLSGSLLPLLLRRLGFDPAKSSAPFVATLVDVTGLIIYFTVARTILSSTLLHVPGR